MNIPNDVISNLGGYREDAKLLTPIEHTPIILSFSNKQYYLMRISIIGKWFISDCDYRRNPDAYEAVDRVFKITAQEAIILAGIFELYSDPDALKAYFDSLDDFEVGRMAFETLPTN